MDLKNELDSSPDAAAPPVEPEPHDHLPAVDEDGVEQDPPHGHRSIITRIATFAARRWQVTMAFLLVVLVSGVSALGFGLDREGFPPINTPISVVSGTYFVDDPARVDEEVVQPLEAVFRDVEGVVETTSEAQPSAFAIVVEFEESISADEGTARLIAAGATAPAEADFEYRGINAAKFVGQYDLLVSIVGPDDAGPAELEAQAVELADFLASDDQIATADVRDLLTTSVNPTTGDEEVRLTRFTRVALDNSGYQDAVAIGVIRADGSSLDVLELSDRVEADLADPANPLAEGYTAEITADFAVGVRSQLDSLTSNLLTGLLAVAFVSLLLIGWRAAVMTAGFMMLVMLGALTGLWTIGYSLNTITLFGLILTLGLLVDDAIVISESIDANRKESKKPLGVIRVALDRVGSASFAGTLTTVVVFSPMLFVGGILGEFIRPIPTTVIVTLLISFLFSIVFIPMIARFFLLRAKPSRNPVVRAEKVAARGMGRLAGYPSGNGWKGRIVGFGLAALAIFAIMTGGRIAGTLGFSIFPTGKDATGITVNAEFPPGTTIEEAQLLADEIDEVVVSELGDELVRSQYVRGNERVIETFVDLTPIDSRSTTAPTFVERIEARTDGIEEANAGVRINVNQLENGPPVLEYPFAVQIEVDESSVGAGEQLAEDIRADLLGQEFEVGGSTVTVVDAIISTDGQVARIDGQRVIEVRAQYDDDESITSYLTTTEDYVAEQYPPDEVESRGLAAGALSFDFGAESDNQDDFAALGVAGMVALVLMLLLITIQFRSLAQSLLIFLAIPFSFLGVFTALSATSNPISFLVAVGFIALIGVAVNNTILLVDAANRARRSGATAGEAIQEAVTRRFRPLVATTITTVVGLLPLSLSDPFWESLGFTLIGGLVSSTTLVLLCFPAFYLGLEAVRTPVRNVVRRRRGKAEIA